jgi:hypothetical protein
MKTKRIVLNSFTRDLMIFMFRSGKAAPVEAKNGKKEKVDEQGSLDR